MDIENTTANGIGKVDPYLGESNVINSCEDCNSDLDGECLFFEGDYYCDAICIVNMMITAGVVIRVE